MTLELKVLDAQWYRVANDRHLRVVLVRDLRGDLSVRVFGYSRMTLRPPTDDLGDLMNPIHGSRPCATPKAEVDMDPTGIRVAVDP